MEDISRMESELLALTAKHDRLVKKARPIGWLDTSYAFALMVGVFVGLVGVGLVLLHGVRYQSAGLIGLGVASFYGLRHGSESIRAYKKQELVVFGELAELTKRLRVARAMELEKSS